LAERLEQALDDHPASGIVMALAMAERSGLTHDDWARFRLTGTSHLFAISGLHVGLAASLGFLFGKAALWVLPVRGLLRAGLVLPWLSGLATAAWYAALAGFQTSTRRALVMLIVLALVRLLARPVGAGHGLLLALAAVLVLNPLAPLGAGFWLSFVAVATLILMFAPRCGPVSPTRGLLLAQAGLALVLAPVALFWFQQVPMMGMVTNLLAIPWVSVGVAPAAIMAAMLAPVEATIARFPLFVAAEGAQLLASGLKLVEGLAASLALSGAGANVALTAAACLGAALMLLPRGCPQRWAGLLLMVPLLLPAWPRRDEVRLEMLDVGQGLSILVEERGQLLLYDAGPGDGASWSMVPRTISPAIAAAGRRAPDRIIISHADLDHAGGLGALTQRYPDAQIFFNTPAPGAKLAECHAPLTWAGQGSVYRVLHPSRGLPYIGNDSSCVLSIRTRGGTILLTGDVGTAIEQRLLLLGLDRHDVLVAGHHGSRSSSHDAFLAQVAPDVALASAGFANRFGLPHPDIRTRYRHLGAPLMNTADCGALRVHLRPGADPVVRSARRDKRAIWHWPPGPDCP
ncbi:MAG: DNA internalization-related competence protein ComEC/Rec2, partial [Xanthomonadales bacterium]|nr:DNA internalization-related competence protein ComEC/Rec2 [Xanthomonadales bacterium]